MNSVQEDFSRLASFHTTAVILGIDWSIGYECSSQRWFFYLKGQPELNNTSLTHLLDDAYDLTTKIGK